MCSQGQLTTVEFTKIYFRPPFLCGLLNFAATFCAWLQFWCVLSLNLGNSVDKLCHTRSVAYSVELVLLNKHQISGGGSKLHCYHKFVRYVVPSDIKLENGRLSDRYRIGTDTGCIVSNRIGYCCIGRYYVHHCRFSMSC